MRLLNINTGILETVNVNFEEDIRTNFIAISHRWLADELNLYKLGLVGLGDYINIGDKLYDDLFSKIKCSTVLNNIQSPNNKNMEIKNFKIYDHENIQKNQKWIDYLNFFNNNKDINKENVNNHYKLFEIINVIKKENKYNYIWLDTLCIDKSSSAELSENIVSV